MKTASKMTLTVSVGHSKLHSLTVITCLLFTVVHLLELLLMFNAAERLSADEALSHTYFADCQHLYDSNSVVASRRPNGSPVVCICCVFMCFIFHSNLAFLNIYLNCWTTQ